MNPQRICFLVHENQYHSKTVFTESFASSLESEGKTCKIINMLTDPSDLLDLESWQPDLTASFSRCDPLSDGKYFFEHLQVPHVHLNLDPVIYYLHLADSPLSFIACVDRGDVELLSARDCERGFFLPHAAEKAAFELPTTDRPYDIVLLGSCYDPVSIRKAWEAELRPEAAQAVEGAIDMVLSGLDFHFVEALGASWAQCGLDPQQENFIQLCWYVDLYSRGKDRLELLRSLSPREVHVFGEVHPLFPGDGAGWDRYAKELDHVVFHPPIPFIEALEVLKQAKVSLNPAPMFPDGSHERVFNSLAAGAACLSTNSEWLQEVFGEQKGISFYSPGDWDSVGAIVDEYLLDDKKRQNMTTAGQAVVREGHTWPARARLFLEELRQF